MSLWICENCDAEREGRCKPQKCSVCEQKGTFVKVVEGNATDPVKEEQNVSSL